MRTSAMNSLHRRTFLQTTGVALALPWLESLHARRAQSADAKSPVRRMVCVCTTLGIHPEHLIPTTPGRDYALTPYLEPLQDLRGDLTVFSGVSHPEVDGGHSSEASFLTAAAHPGASSFKNTISLDQLAVEKLPPATRFPSLVLTTSSGSSISVSRAGVMVPAEGRPSELFKKLFVDGTAKEVAEQTRRLQDGQSIMDVVQGEAKRLQNRVSSQDRAKLDEYFSTVREVEQRLHAAEAWAKRPKPKVDVKPPTDVQNAADFVNRTRLMFDLAHLALETDSTRIITLRIQGHNSVPPIDGITQDWHNLSHHGKDPEKIKQLKVIELEQMKLLGSFLSKLKGSNQGGSSLLDHAMVLYGSNLGNSSSHDTKNMPMLLAGGGFKHGQHLAFDTTKNYPLPNLYVSMLQRLGIETDRFASSTGTMSGLEMV
ncbi:MAG: DUF1552 domain-containing protein [Planctomycetaceae bacterium]|nr:DUF1552 domain-containing protein [Planctomycetaceae bacterium]